MNPYSNGTRFYAWIFIFGLVNSVLSEIYTSVGHMKDELEKRRQDRSVTVLKQLLENQAQRLDKIKRIAQALDDLGSEVRNPDFTVHHPLDAYRFIKNYSIIYTETVTDLEKELKRYKTGQEQLVELTSLLTSLPADDLLGALEGVLRIQFVYDLRTNDIADGNIRNVTKDKMSAAECEDMMAVAYSMKMTHLAREWINKALERVTNGDSTSSHSQILTRGAAVTFKMGDESEAIRIYEALANLNPKNRYHQYKLKFYKKNSPPKTYIDYPYMDPLICDTCQGKKRKQGKLSCRYLDNGHPILRYQPAKLEVISEDPYISVYHNCFSRNILSLLKDSSKPNLERSKTTDGNRAHLTSTLRTSKGVFFQMTKPIEDLYGYVEALTSLRWADSYEKLQVANYGVGGHYDLHSDHRHDLEVGLTDVREGGATAFPFIGEYITPEAGKAVFWYNLYPSGKGNERSKHVACPVINGDKWVGNIWIRSHGQEFIRPCNLEENDIRWKL